VTFFRYAVVMSTNWSTT